MSRVGSRVNRKQTRKSDIAVSYSHPIEILSEVPGFQTSVPLLKSHPLLLPQVSLSVPL